MYKEEIKQMKKVINNLKKNGIKCHSIDNMIVVETPEEGVNLYVWAYVQIEFEDFWGTETSDELPDGDDKPNKFVICDNTGKRLDVAFSFNELISSLKKNLEAF